MRIPDKIMIGKHMIKVKYATPILNEWVGRFHKKSFTIEISTEYPKTMQEEAFIHELLHATSMIYGLGLSEHQVTVLGERVYSNFLPLESKRKENK